MSLDSVRNAAFAKAIHYCVKVGEQRTWLEVGAGADALLTRFVLRSGTVGVGRLASISTSAAAESSKLVLTQTRVCAVEGGAPAAASARRHLAPFRAERVARQRKLKVEGGPGGVAPVALESAWALVQGVSSEPSAARSVAAVAAAWRLPTGRFPAILHELLGFFASSEWAVQVKRGTSSSCVLRHLTASVIEPACLPLSDCSSRIRLFSRRPSCWHPGPVLCPAHCCNVLHSRVFDGDCLWAIIPSLTQFIYAFPSTLAERQPSVEGLRPQPHSVQFLQRT